MADEMNGERESFEAWHSGKFGRAFTTWAEDRGRYTWDLTQELWNAWQARASLAANAGSETMAGMNEYGVRGYLAATLKCWHRLTGDEAAELVAMTQRLAGLYTHPSPPEGMAGWMPIADAPEDEPVLLWSEIKGGAPILDAWGRYMQYNQPLFTHFMLARPPLPASEAKGA